jgi:hypothetical protein
VTESNSTVVSSTPSTTTSNSAIGPSAEQGMS